VNDDHFPGIVEANARGFYAGPAWKWIFPDDRKRLDQLRWIFARGARIRLKYCESYTTDREVLGVSMWSPPTRKAGVPIWDQLTSGLLKVPFKFGPGVLFRLNKFTSHENEFCREIFKAGSFWVVESIVVHPDFQRKGLGGKLLELGLKKADLERMPVFVLTHDPANLAFYGKHGFKLVKETGFGSSGLVSYGMIREPVESL
jgi:GNAT superfamily N-acetyltransferase